MMFFIIETIFLTAELAGCLKLVSLDVLAARLENEQQGKSSALLRIQFN